MSSSLRPHGLQHARLFCPALSPGGCSDSCPLSQYCHSTISSSANPFSFCLPSFLLLESFPMNRLFTSGDQSIGTSALSRSNDYSRLICLRIDWFDLLAVQGTLKSLLQHHNSKASIIQCFNYSSVQFSSVTQLCPTLCDPIKCNMPGFPVHHQLLELTQTRVHQVGDAIQPSRPLSSPSPLTFNLSQHQGLFQ